MVFQFAARCLRCHSDPTGNIAGDNTKYIIIMLTMYILDHIKSLMNIKSGKSTTMFSSHIDRVTFVEMPIKGTNMMCFKISCRSWRSLDTEDYYTIDTEDYYTIDTRKFYIQNDNGSLKKARLHRRLRSLLRQQVHRMVDSGFNPDIVNSEFVVMDITHVISSSGSVWKVTKPKHGILAQTPSNVSYTYNK